MENRHTQSMNNINISDIFNSANEIIDLAKKQIDSLSIDSCHIVSQIKDHQEIFFEQEMNVLKSEFDNFWFLDSQEFPNYKSRKKAYQEILPIQNNQILEKYDMVKNQYLSILNNVMKSINKSEKSGKIKKLINVKEHFRGEELVHQFKRWQLVNEKFSKTEEQKMDQIFPKLEDANYEFENKKYDDWQNRILEAYRNPEHAIYDLGFEKDSYFLYNMFDRLANNDWGWNLHPTNTNSKLTSSEFINSLHINSKELENHFNKLGIETKRLSPFTFKFSNREENPSISTEISSSLRGKTNRGNHIQQNFIENIESTLKLTVQTTYNPHGGDVYAENVLHGNEWLGKALNNLVIGTDLNQNTIKNKILVPMIASQILSPQYYKQIHDHYSNNSYDYFLLSNIRRRLPEDLKNYHALIGDPEVIRKELRKAINDSKEYVDKVDPEHKGAVEKSRQKLLKEIKFMKASDVPIHFTYLMEHDTLFPYIHDQEAMKLINNIADGATKIAFDRYNDMGNIYVSNNPLEKITMSPQGIITSCQSISRDGNLSVDSLNVNVLSAIEEPKDFIMYTKQGNTHFKRERISLNYDGKNLNNFEYGKVYTSEKNNQLFGSLFNSIHKESKISSMFKIISGEDVAQKKFKDLSKRKINPSHILDSLLELTDDANSWLKEKREDFNKQVTSKSEQKNMKEEFDSDQKDIGDEQDYRRNSLTDYFSKENIDDILDEIRSEGMHSNYEYSSDLYGSPRHEAYKLGNEQEYHTIMRERIVEPIYEESNDQFRRINHTWLNTKIKRGEIMEEFERKSINMPDEPED